MMKCHGIAHTYVWHCVVLLITKICDGLHCRKLGHILCMLHWKVLRRHIFIKYWSSYDLISLFGFKQKILRVLDILIRSIILLQPKKVRCFVPMMGDIILLQTKDNEIGDIVLLQQTASEMSYSIFGDILCCGPHHFGRGALVNQKTVQSSAHRYGTRPVWPWIMVLGVQANTAFWHHHCYIYACEYAELFLKLSPYHITSKCLGQLKNCVFILVNYQAGLVPAF